MLAAKVVRKHRLAERLLVDVIGLEWHKVHAEAGRWEHVISDDVEERLVILLGDPATCPHGNPIPGSATRALARAAAAVGRDRARDPRPPRADLRRRRDRHGLPRLPRRARLHSRARPPSCPRGPPTARSSSRSGTRRWRSARSSPAASSSPSPERRRHVELRRPGAAPREGRRRRRRRRVVPAGGPRRQGRPRRRRRRARRGRLAGGHLQPGLAARVPRPPAPPGHRRGARPGQAQARRPRAPTSRCPCPSARSCGTATARCSATWPPAGERWLAAEGGRGGRGNATLPLQPPAGPGLRRAGRAGRGALARPRAQARGRRGAGGLPQRRQVDADLGRSRPPSPRSPTTRSPPSSPTWASCACRRPQRTATWSSS